MKNFDSAIILFLRKRHFWRHFWRPCRCTINLKIFFWGIYLAKSVHSKFQIDRTYRSKVTGGRFFANIPTFWVTTTLPPQFLRTLWWPQFLSNQLETLGGFSCSSKACIKALVDKSDFRYGLQARFCDYFTTFCVHDGGHIFHPMGTRLGDMIDNRLKFVLKLWERNRVIFSYEKMT